MPYPEVRTTVMLYKSVDYGGRYSVILYREEDLFHDILYYLCKRGTRVRGRDIARDIQSAYFLKSHQSLSEDPNCTVVPLSSRTVREQLSAMARFRLLHARGGLGGGYIYRPNWFKVGAYDVDKSCRF